MSYRVIFLMILGLVLGMAGPAGIHADCPVGCHLFMRGDVDDSGTINITDVNNICSCVFYLEHCPSNLDAVDANDDGQLDISDANYLSMYAFQGGLAPPPPFPPLPNDVDWRTPDDIGPESCDDNLIDRTQPPLQPSYDFIETWPLSGYRGFENENEISCAEPGTEGCEASCWQEYEGYVTTTCKTGEAGISMRYSIFEMDEQEKFAMTTMMMSSTGPSASSEQEGLVRAKASLSLSGPGIAQPCSNCEGEDMTIIFEHASEEDIGMGLQFKRVSGGNTIQVYPELKPVRLGNHQWNPAAVAGFISQNGTQCDMWYDPQTDDKDWVFGFSWKEVACLLHAADPTLSSSEYLKLTHVWPGFDGNQFELRAESSTGDDIWTNPIVMARFTFKELEYDLIYSLPE